MSKVPVKSSDYVIGQPLRWDVVDDEGKLLLTKGTVIADAAEKARLMRRRGFRELGFDQVLPSIDEVSAAIRSEAPGDGVQEVRLLFDETHIQTGDPIQLQGSGDGLRYSVRLIGYHKSRSIVVTNPIEEGTSLYLRDGQSFVARGFSGRLAFAFPTSVMVSAVKPYHHVHLAYPVEVVGIRVRKSDRIKLRTIAAFDLADGNRGSGIIVNLSTGGALLLSRSPHLAARLGIVLKFKLTLGGSEYVLELPGQVRSVQPNEDGHEFTTGYGIQFGAVSPEDNLVLSALVSQYLAAAATSHLNGSLV